ncbi:UNVERIFIED_CONTAM: hypothetical protein H355_015313 [Colinus virginianus]|nr:hypothetical protein H355_015313 [Colinus virginianus]
MRSLDFNTRTQITSVFDYMLHTSLAHLPLTTSRA